MEVDNSNLIRVKIVKKCDTGLGFLIQPRTENPHVVISAIVSGGMAEKCGLIRIGDVIVRVNDTDLTGMHYDKCVELLKSLPVDSHVSLLLKGPDGYISYLHTTFLANGTPQTVRITKPNGNNESFVSRLRRTFGRSLSPSGRAPLRQSRSGNVKGNKQKHETDKCENDIIDQSCYVCPADHNNDIVKIQSDAQSQTEVKATKANGGPPTTNPESKNCNIHMNSNNNNPAKTINNTMVELTNMTETLDDGKSHENNMQLSVTSVGNGVEFSSERRQSKGVIRSPSMQRKEGLSQNSPAHQKRYVKLKNVADSKLVFTDTLHFKSIEVSI